MTTSSVSSALDQTIHQLFEEQVLATPARVAVIHNERQVTFAELNRCANQLARYLRSLAVGPDVPVGLCMERSLESIVGFLAILKAGGAYVPLELASPVERKRRILEDARIPVLLTQAKLDSVLPPFSGRRIYLDRRHEASEVEDGDNLSPLVQGSHGLAYVIYTSGSTGQPKGVMGLHRGIVNRLLWMWQTYPYAAGEVACHRTSLAFVDSLCEICGPLLQGVPLVVVPGEGTGDLRYLVRTLAAHRVTRVVLVPALLRGLLEAYPRLHEQLPDLRQCISSGETLPLKLAREFRHRMPHCTLLNLYGSTEVSADVTWYEVPATIPHERVPLGRPIANTTIEIRDTDGRPVPHGAAGELYVRGEGLSSGYLHRPEMTAERFIVDSSPASPPQRWFRTGDFGRLLPDGNIEFLGRADQQVKVLGCRVELGEIEAALSQHPDVAEVVVLAHEAESRGHRLVAYVTRNAAQTVEADALDRWLRQRLPEYMLPASIHILERLPRTVSGKIDRMALAWLEPTAASPAEPQAAADTRIEQLRAIWRQVLDRETIDNDTSFYAVGGDSLRALTMILQVEEAFGVTVPESFFAVPTIQHLARLLWNDQPALAPVLAPAPTVRAEHGGELPAPPSVARVARQSIRSSREAAAFALPPDAGVEAIREWVSDPDVRRRFYGNEVAVVERFCDEFAAQGLAHMDRRHLLTQVLVQSVLFREMDTFSARLTSHPDMGGVLEATRSPFWQPYARLCRPAERTATMFSERYLITGDDHLHRVRSRGQSVVLVPYHTPLVYFLLPALHYLGFSRPVMATWGGRRQHAPAGKATPAQEWMQATQTMRDLMSQLAEGGLIVIQADGLKGQVSAELTVLGRLYPFRSGFAELAVRTGAAVIPTTIHLADDARIRVALHEPFDAGREAQSRDERVLGLLAQFADFYAHNSRQYPESLTLGRMRKFLQLPVAPESCPQP